MSWSQARRTGRFRSANNSLSQTAAQVETKGIELAWRSDAGIEARIPEGLGARFGKNMRSLWLANRLCRTRQAGWHCNGHARSADE
jgi:hypothetical protein